MIVGLVIFEPTASSAFSPHSVESNVRTGWANNYGYKNNDLRSGRNIVYDVYSYKYTNDGYQIVNRNFGSGNQPYLNFQGWAINFGHKRHTSTNHDTYIVARKTSGSSGVGTTYIYKTDHINLSATEEVEYNNLGSGVYNECPANATNKDNMLDCNMRYDNVGFNAFLPLRELFPESDQNAAWTLYLVKRVDSHIVYTDLKLPFTFGNKDYNGGKLSLSSGINANSLKMIGTRVYRRATPSPSAVRDNYFTTGANYTRIDASETGTSIWYGVNVGGGVKRWATSAYWGFNGDRATLSYDAPPKHVSNSMGYVYKNGDDYWTRPNVPVDVNLRQYDQTANARGYIRLYGSGVDARAWHDYGNSSSSWFDYWYKHASVDITGVSRTEKTSQYGTLRWTVNPKTHGHSYDVQYYYQDSAANVIGYTNTGMKLRVDGVGPGVSYRNSADTANFTSRTWSSDEIRVRLKLSDSHSGYKRSRHQWTTSTTTPSSWSGWNASSNYEVTRKTSGEWYLHVQSEDNVGNTTTNYSGPYRFNVPPVPNFTWNPTTIYNDTPVNFTNSSTDEDGHSLNYKWEYQSPGSSTWVQFSTATHPTGYTFNNKGIFNIRLTASDGIESKSVTKSFTVQNRPPVANFSWSPSTVYNDTNVTFSNSSIDLDGDALSYQWAYQEPGTSSWVNFSTAKNPSKILNKKKEWNIRLTVSDGEASHSVTKEITVQNRAPIANFSWSPSTIYNDTTVSFSNSSIDADKDSLSYRWEYQEPNSSTWVDFSTTTTPSRIFNKKGTWNIRLTVSDGTASHSVTKSLTVQNRAPVANFSWSPSTIYNDTTVSFSNSSIDADKDSLSYRWEYQEPNSTTWVSFSTDVNPKRVLNKQEVWKIRLTVSDGTASHSVTKSITVQNRTPIPNFTATPNPTDRLTTVHFTNTSSDPDKDSLTYIWEYRIKGTTTWTRMATTTNANFKFPKVATYEVRLTASDKWVSASKSLDVVVNNIKPVVELTYELPNSPLPDEVWEGDTVKVCARVTDAENDPMTVKIYIKKDGGTEKLVLNESNLTSGNRPCYTFVTEVGRYDVRITVNDPYDEITTSTWFYSKQLTLSGDVKHTPDWLKKHKELNHGLYQFYSGERFLLEGYTSPYPTNYVKVTLNSSHSNGVPVKRLVTLSKVSTILYKGELYDKIFLEHGTTLKEGPSSFEFEVQYTNGVIKKYIVPIEIIGEGFQQYRIHRKF